MAENSDFTEVIDEHYQNIEKLCRLCGKETKLKQRTGKFKFVRDILDVFQIDINEDHDFIHPNYLCNSCRCILFRYRTSKTKKSKSDISITLRDYQPHSSNCEICYTDIILENTSEQSSIDKIIEMFSSLENHEKEDCLSKLIKNVFSNNRLKSKVNTLQESHPFNKITVLESLELSCYYKQFDNVLVESILAFTDQTIENISMKHFIPVLESIYRLCYPEFVGPWSFMQNLTIYSATKSTQACNVLGTAIPASKYSTLYNFVTDINTGREANCPPGDVIFMFDNEQVVGKTWNVSAASKVKISVITNVSVIRVNDNKNLQEKEELMPGKWINSNEKEDLISELCQHEEHDGFQTKDFFSGVTDDHYNEVYRIIDIAIDQITEDLTFDSENEIFIDYIDKKIEELEMDKQFKKCPKCNLLLEKNKRKCTHCNISIAEYKKKHNQREDDGKKESNDWQYRKSQIVLEHPLNGEVIPQMNPALKFNHIESYHSGKSTETVLLDPVFVNPNSIDSIVLVLRHIGKKAHISKYNQPNILQSIVRYWTFVCCDGLPHGLVRRVIEEYFVCSICGEGIYGLKETEDHDKKVHSPNGSTYTQEFDWVFLICGDGHYEMNLMKSFVELNWNVFMKSLVEIMGFQSEKAQKTALNCSDNHKTWQIILIFHLGTILELVKPYVEERLLAKEDATPHGFLSYVKSKKNNANYLYLFEMTCRYTQAIINLRMAIRRNNPALLQSSKWMSKELFHGRNHPKYQDIQIYDGFRQHIFPNEIKEHFSKQCSISKSGNKSKGQGYDFLLEEDNKLVKSWLKRGVPTEKHWLATCRNHESLKMIRRNVLNKTGNSKEESSDKQPKLDQAIAEWRLRLRQTEYIKDEKHGPVLTSINAEVLDQELLNFTAEANRKRSYRMMDMLLHQPPPNDPTIQHPVYVLPSEREKYSSIDALSIADIDNKILDFIDVLNGQNKLLFQSLFITMKKDKASRKKDHVQFLEEIETVASYSELIQDDQGLLDEEFDVDQE